MLPAFFLSASWYLLTLLYTVFYLRNTLLKRKIHLCDTNASIKSVKIVFLLASDRAVLFFETRWKISVAKKVECFVSLSKKINKKHLETLKNNCKIYSNYTQTRNFKLMTFNHLWKILENFIFPHSKSKYERFVA